MIEAEKSDFTYVIGEPVVDEVPEAEDIYKRNG